MISDLLTFHCTRTGKSYRFSVRWVLC